MESGTHGLKFFTRDLNSEGQKGYKTVVNIGLQYFLFNVFHLQPLNDSTWVIVTMYLLISSSFHTSTNSVA